MMATQESWSTKNAERTLDTKCLRKVVAHYLALLRLPLHALPFAPHSVHFPVSLDSPIPFSPMQTLSPLLCQLSCTSSPAPAAYTDPITSLHALLHSSCAVDPTVGNVMSRCWAMLGCKIKDIGGANENQSGCSVMVQNNENARWTCKRYFAGKSQPPPQTPRKTNKPHS